MKYIDVKNPDALRRKIQSFAKQYPEVAAEALWLEVRIIQTISLQQVPIDTGQLLGTGADGVRDPVISEGNISVKFGYSTDYAVYVHENLEAYHEPPTKAKYLEDPANERAPFILGNVARRVATMLEEET